MDYSGSLTKTLTDTAGNVFGFEDYQTAFNYLRVKVAHGSVTSGKLWLNATLNTRK